MYIKCTYGYIKCFFFPLYFHSAVPLSHARLGADAQSPVYTDHWWHMVVLHPHYHLVLHGQPRGLPDGGEDGIPHRLGRWLGKADKNRVWSSEGWSYHDLLQGETRQRLSAFQAEMPTGAGTKIQRQKSLPSHPCCSCHAASCTLTSCPHWDCGSPEPLQG